MGNCSIEDPMNKNGYTIDNIDFYHLRLSILDISGGKQPMHLAERFTIIFNGQIYNHQELRQQFNINGNTTSDTETLLLLYQKLGTSMLQYLDGMFVFAMYDRQQKQLFIARDRAGVKPLYYYKDAEKIVFTSELNCMKALLPLQINEQNIYHYLRLGSFYKQQTPYKNVAELNAGSFLLIDCKSLDLQETKWWNINSLYKKSNGDDFETSLAKVDKMLHQGVKRRVESSDLEVGSFLSGGIDSGLVTAIGKRIQPSAKNIYSFLCRRI